MLTDTYMKKLFRELGQERHVELAVMGSNLTLHLEESENMLYISSPVYLGGNYIPQSVRDCLRQKPPFGPSPVSSYPVLHEEHFEIILNHRESTIDMRADHFAWVIEEFAILANEWRDWLDQHDKNDLVWVRAPSH